MPCHDFGSPASGMATTVGLLGAGAEASQLSSVTKSSNTWTLSKASEGSRAEGTSSGWKQWRNHGPHQRMQVHACDQKLGVLEAQ